jgi:phospholipid transport system transporter-binding protein
MDKLHININNNIVYIEGELSRQTVPEYNLKQITKLLSEKSLNFDFSQLQKADTAGLAWLLLIVEQASKTACALSFTHLPKELLNLIELSGVTEFLPIIELS